MACSRLYLVATASASDPSLWQVYLIGIGAGLSAGTLMRSIKDARAIPQTPAASIFLEVSTEGKVLLASNCPIKRGRHKADATAGGSKRRLPPSTQSVTSVTVYTTVFTARHRTAALGDHSATLLRPSISRAIPAEDARLRRRTQARGAAARCWSHPCRP